MASTIKIKNSSTTGAVPTSSDLVQGELAINVTDRSIYTENASGTVVKLNAPSIDDKNTGATKYLTIDTSGNLGLGVVPSSWATYKAMEVGGAALSLMGGTSGAIFGSLGVNWYFDGTNRVYKNTAAATYYNQANGAHAWYYAASGTAGNTISFTQAMTLDASGNLGVGSTSPNIAGVNKAITLNTTNGTSGAIYEIAVSGTNYAYLFANSTNTVLSSVQNLPLVFNTNNTERARIDTSGNLLVGTTADAGVGVSIKNDSGVLGRIIIKKSFSGNTDGIPFYYNATYVGGITYSNTAVAYATSSDYRLKEDIQPMTSALAKVTALKPVTYKWKADGTESQGFIAHELQAVVPECVIGEKDAVNEDGTPKYQGIDTSFLVATLTAAIQEQQAIIESLTQRITALEQA